MVDRQVNRFPISAWRALACLVAFLGPWPLMAQIKDTAVTLEKVTVSDSRNPGGFRTAIPVQSLDQQILKNITAQTVGDAARYFSGVLVKDYGGVGGLKTISVRSLGASSTGILYDGIPVSDLQTGQIDLSRFPSTFVRSMDLYQATPVQLLTPARAFSAASVLAINTHTFRPANLEKRKWQTGAQVGSFGHWHPYAGIYLPLKKNFVISANAETILSKGNYPFFIENGNFSEKERRTNSDVASVQVEANMLKLFRDSSFFQVKAFSFSSDRGLPGAIIFFNTRSAQRLANRDVFVQGRYENFHGKKTGFLLSIKYANNFTRYSDPDFLNNQGGLDSRYRQQEIYGSVSASHQFTNRLSAAIATDLASTSLESNQSNFVHPTRNGMWNNLAIRYRTDVITVAGSLLNTYFHDKTALPVRRLDHDRITPTVSFSFQPESSSFLFRGFYKETFRMPTFNDLYYNFIGNRNLRPEMLTQYNLGLTYSRSVSEKISRINISLDGYFNTIKDKIIAVPMQNLFNWSMLNIGRVHIKGIDVNAEANLNFSAISTLFIRAAYTWQQATDVTNPQSDVYKNRIPYTPDHSGSAIAIYRFRKWTTAYSILFSGNRFALGANHPSNELEGWAVHDLSLSRALQFRLFQATLKVAVNNISDKRYDVVRYFPMPGRNFLFSISFNQQ